jgi:hypothetical protein
VTDALGLSDPTPDSRVITVSNRPPTAVLGVTPASGNEPLSVTADASASSDPDGTITAYLFDFGDGTVVGPQASPIATHVYAAGSWTAHLSVTDNLGATTSANVPVIAASVGSGPNLIGNPSFETNTTGWSNYGGATSLRVTGGLDGTYALQISGPATLATFGLNDSPNWVVTTPAAGVRYRYTAWIRSASSTGRLRLKLREYLSGTQVGTTVYSSFVTLSPSWQMLTADIVTQTAGSTLDLQVLDDAPAAAGEVFLLDNVSSYIVP